MALPQGILVCQTFQVIFASQPYVVSLLPRGDCKLCCQVDLENDVIFMTHLRSGESVRAGVEAGAPMLDPNKPTVVYVHGFADQGDGASASTVRRAYFAAGHDVNFVTMDWARLVAFPWYANAVGNVPTAGRYLARFLERLFQDGVRPSDTHVVGFSLGAEVAGLAGKSLAPGYRLGRITGLDPAFPLFRWTSRGGHLSDGDADFVDVIHTDGGHNGVAFPIGHADFYPNGGRSQQPGCSASALLAKTRADPQAQQQFPLELFGCSHSRAWVYYAESLLRPSEFVALRCQSERDFRNGRCERDTLFRSDLANDTTVALALMGAAASRGCRGSYYLETNDQFPFARGLYFPKIKSLFSVK